MIEIVYGNRISVRVMSRLDRGGSKEEAEKVCRLDAAKNCPADLVPEFRSGEEDYGNSVWHEWRAVRNG